MCRACREALVSLGTGYGGENAMPVAVPIGPYNVVIRAHIETVKLLSALLALLAFFGFATCGFAAAKRVPLPRPRPAEIARPEPPAEASAEEPAPSSACRLRLTAEIAVAAGADRTRRMQRGGCGAARGGVARRQDSGRGDAARDSSLQFRRGHRAVGARGPGAGGARFRETAQERRQLRSL